MSLRLGKCWQGTAAFLIFQAETQLDSDPSTENTRWRGYLMIDLRPRPGTVTLIEQKPDDLLAAGAITNLIRKHAPGGRLTSILEHKESGDLWLALHSGAQHFFKLSKSNPPEFSLISPMTGVSEPLEYTTIARMSTSGMFTKKHDYRGWIPTENKDVSLTCVEKLPDLLKSISSIGKSAGDPSSQNTDAPPTDALTNFTPTTDAPITLALHQREGRDRLARRLKTLKKSLSQSKSKTPDATASGSLEQQAQWLKTFSWLIKPGMHELKLDPAQTGLAESIVLQIDPEESAGAQIDRLFVAAKKSKKGRAMGIVRAQDLAIQLADLESDLAAIRDRPMSADQVDALLEKYGLQKRTSAKTIADAQRPIDKRSSKLSKFRSFSSEGGVPVFVGRTAVENDELTKCANSNDWWFHAVGIHGSHVVIPAKLVGPTLPAQVLRDAGILAIHFSKFKENRAGEVYVTRKQNLRKQKGMAAGMWTVLRSETVMIRYEQEELDRLFLGSAANPDASQLKGKHNK